LRTVSKIKNDVKQPRAGTFFVTTNSIRETSAGSVNASCKASTFPPINAPTYSRASKSLGAIQVLSRTADALAMKNARLTATSGIKKSTSFSGKAAMSAAAPEKTREAS